MAVLKIRTKIGFDIETVYIPTWKIVYITAGEDYITIFYEALIGDSEGGLSVDGITVRLPFTEKDYKEKLRLSEIVAEEILKYLRDKSNKILDIDELIKTLQGFD